MLFGPSDAPLPPPSNCKGAGGGGGISSGAGGKPWAPRGTCLCGWEQTRTMKELRTPPPSSPPFPSRRACASPGLSPFRPPSPSGGPPALSGGCRWAVTVHVGTADLMLAVIPEQQEVVGNAHVPQGPPAAQILLVRLVQFADEKVQVIEPTVNVAEDADGGLHPHERIRLGLHQLREHGRISGTEGGGRGRVPGSGLQGPASKDVGLRPNVWGGTKRRVCFTATRSDRACHRGLHCSVFRVVSSTNSLLCASIHTLWWLGIESRSRPVSLPVAWSAVACWPVECNDSWWLTTRCPPRSFVDAGQRPNIWARRGGGGGGLRPN